MLHFFLYFLTRFLFLLFLPNNFLFSSRLAWCDDFILLCIFLRSIIHFINENQYQKYSHHSNNYYCFWTFRSCNYFCLHRIQSKSFACIFHLTLLNFYFHIIYIVNRLKRRVKLGIFCVPTCFLTKYSVITGRSIILFFIRCKLICIWTNRLRLDTVNKILSLHQPFFHFNLFKSLLY